MRINLRMRLIMAILGLEVWLVLVFTTLYRVPHHLRDLYCHLRQVWEYHLKVLAINYLRTNSTRNLTGSHLDSLPRMDKALHLHHKDSFRLMLLVIINPSSILIEELRIHNKCHHLAILPILVDTNWLHFPLSSKMVQTEHTSNSCSNSLLITKLCKHNEHLIHSMHRVHHLVRRDSSRLRMHG